MVMLYICLSTDFEFLLWLSGLARGAARGHRPSSFSGSCAGSGLLPRDLSRDKIEIGFLSCECGEDGRCSPNIAAR
jgi:hypothetical protein